MRDKKSLSCCSHHRQFRYSAPKDAEGAQFANSKGAETFLWSATPN